MQDDEYGRNHASGLHCTGRELLNLWRIMKTELKLGSYTFENCAAAVLRLRVPCVSEQQLSSWFRGGRCQMSRNMSSPEGGPEAFAP